jgi:gamma-glutamylaminecyclotransferase
MSQDKKTNVFVYGTLKQHFHNHGLLSKSTLLGDAITVEKFLMLDGGFPVVLQSLGVANKRAVRGEVYEIDAATLRNLDRLEGEGRMYDRKIVQVRLDGAAEAIDVSIYIGCASWKKFLERPDSLSTKFDVDGNYDWH